MDRILKGWKEIEEWLGLTRKTILRLGYPITRRGKGAVPYAAKDLLEGHSRRLACRGLAYPRVWPRKPKPGKPGARVLVAKFGIAR